MDDQKMKSDKKRENDTLEPKENKRMRPKTPEEPDASTNITDLNDDCLEFIFKKLDLSDLLNVADSSKCFKQTVDIVYTSKYAKMKVDITVCQHKPLITFFGDYISINNQLISLKLLRCFGHLISNLVIHYERKHWAKLDEYVIEYCVDSLNEIGLRYATKETLRHLTKPFSKIENIELRYCTLGSYLTDFNKWFPQMRCLKIFSEVTKIFQGPDSIDIDKHFSNLENLAIYIWGCHGNESFDCSDLNEVIRLNPQLRSLVVSKMHHVSRKFIEHINEHLQCLESLKIVCTQFIKPNDSVVHVKNVKNFILHTDEIDLSKIPLSFERLETFTVYADKKMEINSDFMIFINQHRSSLTKVSLTNSNIADLLKNINKTELATAMKLLTEIDLGYGILTVKEAVNFLRICKMLKTLRFKLSPDSEEEDLMKRIGSEWRFSSYKPYCRYSKHNSVNLIKLDRIFA